MSSSGPVSPLLREIGQLSGLSELFCQYTIEQACQKSGVSTTNPTVQEVRKALPEFARSLRIYLGATEAARRMEIIESHLRSQQWTEASARVQTWQVAREADIGVVRAHVRDLCLQLGVKEAPLQKACTVTSELTRNMVSYAGGGTLTAEVVRIDGGMQAIRMTAKDRGKGIPNLQEILSGQYRSKTGLGLGILGTKRLSHKFDIETGPQGTTICVEVKL